MVVAYTSEKQNIHIQHAYNGGESEGGTLIYWTDIIEETNTAYEVNGCFWHGKFI